MSEHPVSELYKQLGTKILRFVLKRSGGDLNFAKQVVQDTFVAAFKSYSTFRHKSSYFTWLCKIALHKMTDYYRGQVNAHSHLVVPTLEQLDRLVDPQISPEERVSLNEFKQNVNRCLDLLPGQYRRLLHLKYYLDLSNREICLKLNLSPRKVEGRLYRARQALAGIVSRRYPHLKDL
jgi:RNA polymerase sigma-70 factor (ECF subfamily)